MGETIGNWARAEAWIQRANAETDPLLRAQCYEFANAARSAAVEASPSLLQPLREKPDAQWAWLGHPQLQNHGRPGVVRPQIGPSTAAIQRSQVSRLLEAYTHRGKHDEGIAQEFHGEELELTEDQLVERLRTADAAKQAFAACVLGLHYMPTRSIVHALNAARTAKRYEVRVQSLLARVSLAQRAEADDQRDHQLDEHLMQALVHDRSYVVQLAAAESLAQRKRSPEVVVPILLKLLTQYRGKRAEAPLMKTLVAYRVTTPEVVRAVEETRLDCEWHGLTYWHARYAMILKHSTDEQLRREAHEYFEDAVRRAPDSWRRKALRVLLECNPPKEQAINLLIERMYLDCSSTVRDYARDRLIKMDPWLAERLRAHEDKSR